jgi:hypothetical protein
MEFLASLFIGKPLNILALAGPFLAGYLVLRFTAFGVARHPRSLLIASAAWALYAAWEWLVQIKTPEANVRVDLMLIWPVVLIVSIWFSVRAFR